jgi:hypothetical protein
MGIKKLLICSKEDAMKSIVKLIISLSVMLLLVQKTTHAQTYIEFTGGLTSAVLRGNEEEILEDGGYFFRKYAVNISAQITFTVTDNFSLRSGLGYNRRGSGVETSSYSYPFNIPNMNFISLNYVELPLLAVVGSEAFNLHLGPQLSWLVSSDGIEGIDKKDFGIKYGFGINPGSFFVIRMNFYSGISNLAPSNTVKIRNGNYEFNIGLRFPRTKR